MPGMNLLEGRVAIEAGRPVLRGSGFAWPLPDRVGELPEGRELVGGIRPQALRPAQGAGLLRLQVDVIEYLGVESLLVGRLAGGSEGRVTAVLPGQAGDLVRQTVALDFDPADLHVFDKSTGRRVGG
jgi:ABC-type sugar transport system ATPase subunit